MISVLLSNLSVLKVGCVGFRFEGLCIMQDRLQLLCRVWGEYLISVMSFLSRDLRALSAQSNVGSASSRSWFRGPWSLGNLNQIDCFPPGLQALQVNS